MKIEMLNKLVKELTDKKEPIGKSYRLDQKQQFARKMFGQLPNVYKDKKLFIIKFKDKIIIKDEKDIINFEVNNKSILFNYFEKIFQVINQQHYSSNVLIIIVFILILCFSKKIKKYILKIREFFVKKNK
jgi:hypothetical protein